MNVIYMHDQALAEAERAREAHLRDSSRQNVHASMDRLLFFLKRCRDALDALEWDAVTRSLRAHPLFFMLSDEPLFARANAKPRGYPGDAVLMDWIYGYNELPGNAPLLVRSLHEWELAAPGSQSVRERRVLLASRIDELCQARRSPRVLSVAAGHLREVDVSTAFLSDRVGELVAIDADEQNIDAVRRRNAKRRLSAVRASIVDLLSGRLDLGEFDLVYTVWLYDYLSDKLARELLGKLFRLTAPGGMLLVANFAPSLPDIGYMEAFLDWRLVYRDESDMEDLAASLCRAEVASQRTFRDTPRGVVYLEVTKNGAARAAS